MSDSKHRNPHRKDSVYWKLFQYMQQHQYFTRQELLETKIGSYHDIAIILSPRLTSKRGDCRGNPAAHGETHYIQTFPKKIRGEYKKFRLRWRNEPLPSKNRVPVVKAQKEAVAEVSKVEAKV